MVLPTEQEIALVKRSVEEKRELGLVTVRDQLEVIVGEAHEVDSSKVIAVLKRLGHEKGQPWSNTHTHWEKISGRSPFPSIADRIQRVIFNMNRPVCEYRIAFPFYTESRALILLDDRG